MEHRNWYPICNDIVDGWAVSNINRPMSEQPQFQGNLAEKTGYIIAECITEEDAIIIATSLNKINYDPSNREWAKALLDSKDN